MAVCISWNGISREVGLALMMYAATLIMTAALSICKNQDWSPLAMQILCLIPWVIGLFAIVKEASELITLGAVITWGISSLIMQAITGEYLEIVVTGLLSITFILLKQARYAHQQ